MRVYFGSEQKLTPPSVRYYLGDIEWVEEKPTDNTDFINIEYCDLEPSRYTTHVIFITAYNRVYIDVDRIKYHIYEAEALTLSECFAMI